MDRDRNDVVEIDEDLPDGIFFTAELDALKHSKEAAAFAMKKRDCAFVEEFLREGPNGEFRVRNWIEQPEPEGTGAAAAETAAAPETGASPEESPGWMKLIAKIASEWMG